MTKIRALDFVRKGFPPDEGVRFADALLANEDEDWSNLEVDLRGCAAALLIGAFFNGFLQRVADRRPEPRLGRAIFVHARSDARI